MPQPTFSDGIGYEGKVTLTLKSNNRVLSSKIYKNKGTAQLFKFLGYCLIDSYEEAKKYLPNKIMLLKNISSDRRNPQSTSVVPCSDWQTLAKTPTIISENDEVKVVYSFEIPRAAVEGEFNQVALYGALADAPTEFSAYYYLKDVYEELENQKIEDWSATTVLLIEWELNLSNKNTETNTNQREQV